jgi:hypothetical protein
MLYIQRMDFGSFVERCEMSIGAWWTSQQWGSVADWFTGILTALSVFLVIWLLRGDRNRDRSRQANALSVWATPNLTLDKAKPYRATIYVFNAGDEPIPVAWLRVTHRGISASWQLRNPETNNPVIWGKESFSIVWDSKDEIIADGSDFEVFLVDSTHQYWKRNLKTNRTKRLSTWPMPGGIS